MSEPRSIQRFILPLLLASLSCCGNLRANAPLALPGHALKLDETAKHWDGALVATLEKVEFGIVEPVWLTTYMTQWKVNRVLRGKYSSETSLSLEVEFESEQLPIVGKTYILIVKSPKGYSSMTDVVLDNTDENLEKVKKLLQPQPVKT